ncbi:MAG: hypothetical protein CVU32_00510 [Betaproteobacteria bacterium HGW-Betaproteobacteria-5]|nr:MAG: hypothetical protein CVU32_00510 [Betaproteobacteria bacterium HGW-Betaproteobacteria-5]
MAARDSNDEPPTVIINAIRKPLEFRALSNGASSRCIEACQSIPETDRAFTHSILEWYRLQVDVAVNN